MERMGQKTIIYGILDHDAKPVAEDPTLPSEDEKKKIAAVFGKVLPENTSTMLVLSGFLLDTVPDAIHGLSSTLVILDLSNNNLQMLPKAVTSLVNLVSLDVHSNQMTSLPDWIRCLVKLKILNVSGNLLLALPDGIEGCCALEELIADFNQLTRLPEGLGFDLVNLRKLSVNSNRLTRLPYSTSHMMRLRVLDAHLNCLGSLPADLENLTNLETLNISMNFNYFVTLPESVGGLSGLVELDVSYNHIKALPYSIARLEKLQRLKVEGNPLVVPPPHIVNHSVAAVQEYLGERLKMCSREKNGGRLGHTSSWLGRVVSGCKWRAQENRYSCGTVVSLKEGRFSSACGNVFSPRRMFSPGRSASPFRAFATPFRSRGSNSNETQKICLV